MKLNVEIASEVHTSYAHDISMLLAESAKQRKIGRGKRSPELIANKMKNGQAIIALSDSELAGFSYLEPWDNESFVVNTGLIIAPAFRSKGLSKKIKTMALELAASKYPHAKLFSLTSSLAVMKTNTALGYQAVTFSELPKDKKFWTGCQSCPNYKMLKNKDFRICFCTAMLLDNTASALSKLSKNNHEK